MTEVVMPKWGLAMEQGTISLWLKEIGQAVAEGEPLFVAETDKAEAEVESPASGVLGEILVECGTIAMPGTTVGRIYSRDEWAER
ncbi:MAG: biotin attachment protein [Gemmatimonadetes bacterium]|nr:biotin attachment protein [Gemmatimonadota bacterium]